MNSKLVIIIAIAAIAVWLALDSFFTVRATERAIVLRFGAVVQEDLEPGLHFKWPIAERVRKTDARVVMLDHVPERYLTIEKKPLMVDWYAKWRVQDVSRYYQSSSFEATRAMNLLQQRVSEGLRNQISRRDMHEVISGARDELMAELTADLDRVMRREFGVEVLDVRVKRIDLPPEVSSAVFERMRSEREIEARQHRVVELEGRTEDVLGNAVQTRWRSSPDGTETLSPGNSSVDHAASHFPDRHSEARTVKAILRYGCGIRYGWNLGIRPRNRPRNRRGITPEHLANNLAIHSRWRRRSASRAA
jgi:regulator of protease activity HflC (stomatin/prohibitin superfamily)